MSDCKLPITIPELNNLVNDLQKRYEENILTELNEDETRAANEIIDELQDVITKINTQFKTNISIDKEGFKNLLERLYRLPDKTLVGGIGTLTNGESDVIEVPRTFTLKRDFYAILSLLAGILCFYIAFIALSNIPIELSEISETRPEIKQVYDAIVNEYGKDEITLIAFIWNSITQFNCLEEHAYKMRNIITTVLSRTIKNTVLTASNVCGSRVNVVTGNWKFLDWDIGHMVNTGATTVINTWNSGAINRCITSETFAAQEQLLADIKHLNTTLGNFTDSKVSLITTLVKIGLTSTYSSAFYLILSMSEKARRVMNRQGPTQVLTQGPTPVTGDYDGLEIKGGIRKKAKKSRKNKRNKTRKLKRGNIKQTKNRKRHPTKKH